MRLAPGRVSSSQPDCFFPLAPLFVATRILNRSHANTVNRRKFVKTSIGATACAGLVGGEPNSTTEAQQTSAAAGKAAKPLRLLILGGTGFIGPHQVRYALDRGHKITLFNRGRTNPGLFPQVEKLQGDRSKGELDALKNKEWDAVIDNPATLPRWVRESAGLLKNSAQQYVFISTISVYADNSKPGMDESTALSTVSDPATEKVTGETYGGLKALAEQEAERAFPQKTTIIRPGLIVGPGDLTDRFSYWPVRISRGGEVLAPGTPNDPVQIIDARDLAEWTIRMVEQNATGVYNATGPQAPLSMAEMLYGVRAVTSADVRFTWVDADFLEKEKVEPWSDMPVWIPPRGDYAGFGSRNNRRALAKGLTFRPLADTTQATLDWYHSRPAAEQAKLRSGLAPEREQAVLAAWHASRKAEVKG